MVYKTLGQGEEGNRAIFLQKDGDFLELAAESLRRTSGICEIKWVTSPPDLILDIHHGPCGGSNGNGPYSFIDLVI